MAGIYLHIPFCRQKCFYCNFFSIASQKYRFEFVESLIREILLRKEYLQEEPVKTIYFGGGTPSLLSAEEINRIIDKINESFDVNADAEITLEANPDDLNGVTISELKNSPVNRLSIGVQSFFKQDLEYLHRVHDEKQSIKSIQLALEAGFENISMDLIYGIPTLTDKNWIGNLEKFISFGLPHLSAYALTVEPKTPLDNFIKKGRVKPVLDQKIVDQYNILIEKISMIGFLQYEISNFCREPFFSKHNKSYWTGEKYLGLGPSAHSFNGNSRQWNVSNVGRYIQSVNDGNPEFEVEALTVEQKFNEYILTSLRTMWGIDVNSIREEFGTKYLDHFQQQLAIHLQQGTIVNEGNIYKLSRSGKLFADGIAADIFV
ncbi:MAG: radical SAM family heme chaperone HemW [Bacteroidales bacterium]|nr:radical SAM family heme chaperone HemW [Bacteroidales bacterium]